MITKNDFKRFYDKINVSNNGCWNWTASTNGVGYGEFIWQGRKWYAHRFSYLARNGFISPSLIICHKCDNPSCVNPEHLSLGTHQDNANDMVKKGRQKGNGFCNKGHEITGENAGKDNRGGRYCRQCSRDRRLANYYKKKKENALQTIR